MAIPISYVDNYSAALNRATSTARTAAFDALQKIDYSADIADIRDASIAVLETACAASAQVSATVANEFYNAVRVLETGERIAAIVDTGRKPEATAEAVRAFVQLLVDGASPEDFIARCVDRVDYETRKAANVNMAANAKRDPKKPKWARVPTNGEETCDFCLMLASRGFVYGSVDLASHAHTNCRCCVVPGWEETPEIAGFNPDAYFDDYLTTIAAAKKEHADKLLKDSGLASVSVRSMGRGSKFDSINSMVDYITSSKTIDELYTRSELVMQDYKDHWKTNNKAYSTQIFDRLSYAAKKTRTRLMK